VTLEIPDEGLRVLQNLKRKKKTLALIYDLPETLNSGVEALFPDDATAEWESLETIEKLAGTWDALGFSVLRMPLDLNFLADWTKQRGEIDLVHSVVEGWGSIAREGWIPSLCELSGVPYIGSGPLAQNVSMKKSLTKVLCQSLHVRTAAFFLIRSLSDLLLVPSAFLEAKHFIKPDAEGSGMGIDVDHSISCSEKSTCETVTTLLEKYPDGVLLEEYLEGAEFTSALLGTPFVSLPIAQIEVDSGVYGLSNKSKDAMTEKVTFPSLPVEIQLEIEKGGLHLARALHMMDFVRFDWKMDSQGRICFLEANPLAGLSYYYSVLPKMAEAAGLKYEELLLTLANSALERKNARHYWYGRSRLCSEIRS
jgi:D-alanine-D-alanine ligase